MQDLKADSAAPALPQLRPPSSRCLRFFRVALIQSVNEHVGGKDVFSWRGTYVRENSDLVASLAGGAAAVADHHLNAFNTNAEYHFGNRYSAAVSWFTTTGTRDPLLFPQAAVTGSATGSPQSTGYSLNFSVWPIQNLDLAVQYTGYTRFNGAGNNYDAEGRNPSGNNTVYLLARFVF